MLITDDLLFHYQRCSRRAFLNVHGDQEQKQPEKDFRQKLKEESENHCQTILAKFYPIYHQPKSPKDDLWKRSLETETLMKQGVDCIYQGIIHYSNYDNVTYFGSPTLLVKQNIPSSWGKWSYYPVTIQFGNHPKTEYKILSGFYGYLLGKVQGLTPSTSTLILRDCNFRYLNLKIWIDRCLQEIKECLKMLRQIFIIY